MDYFFLDTNQMLCKASYHFTGVNLSQIIDTLCSMNYKTSQPIKNHNYILIALVLVEGGATLLRKRSI